MIQDGTKDDDIKDDDILEDDFDIDDFDEEWDDQDDVVDDVGTNDPAVDAPAATGEKTFLQKFFLPVVIGVVALFALIFVLGSGMLSSGSEEVNPNNANLVPDVAESPTIPGSDEPVLEEDFPDNTSDVAANTPQDNMAPAPSEDGPLRPLPGEDSSEPFELADLEAELEDGTDNFLNETSELIDPVMEDVDSASDSVQDLFDDTPETSDEMSDNSDLAETQTLDAPAFADNSSDNADLPFGENDLQASNDADLPGDNSLTLDTNAPPMEPVSQNTENENEADIAILESENEALQQDKNALQETIAENRETIDSLQAQIAALEERINSMSNNAPVSETTTNTASTQEQEQDAPEQAPPKAIAKPAISAPEWTLKSAQPGKATISTAGSNDLENIEVGSVVRGLGRIESIDVENGRWVVRGTQASVSQ